MSTHSIVGTGVKSEQEQILPTPENKAKEHAHLLPLSAGAIELTSWCPGGSASGGICTPPNNVYRSTWMERYRACRMLPIGEALLPGSHQSAFDKEAPNTPSMETCQDVSIYRQLTQGIRVLDLRVQFFSGASGRNRFAIFHATTNGRYVETDILDELLRYRRNESAHKEILILDFHELKNFTPAAHAELAEVIKRKLGDSIIPPSCQDAAILQLWTMGRSTVVAYNATSDGLFWRGVNQRWIGSNTPTKNELDKFIKKVGAEAKPFGQLRAVQAAYYSLPFFVPKDLSQDLMNWFAVTDQGGPIAGHYIINSDWSLRQRLIDNIIHANGIRTAQRNAHVIYSKPNDSGAVVQTNAYGIYELFDGNFSAHLRFASNTSGYTSIQLISSHATYSSEISWGNGSSRKIHRGDRLLFRVPSGGQPQLLEAFSG